MKPGGTAIAVPLRLWFVVEVFFGLGAVLTIALFPTEARKNFAWDVQPAVMASMLGAYYVSTALLFVLPLLAKRWEMIRVMILPTAIFSTAELVTTFLHIDRFLVGTPAFYAWFISYLLPPPIFFGYYVWQERRARKLAPDEPAAPLPSEVRTGLIHWGGLLTIVSLLLFIYPAPLIAAAPWPMTALTARALLSWFIAVGTLMLSMARENNRSRVLVGVPALLLIFPVVTLQLARFANQIDFANVALFVAYGFMLVAFALGIYLVRGPWREVVR
jgi:hypothetical protein